LLKVARSTLYYQHVAADADDLAVMRPIDKLHLENTFYGSWRMAVVLWDDGWAVNRKRAQRLLRMMGLERSIRNPTPSRPHPEHRLVGVP
jgi:putative transposase